MRLFLRALSFLLPVTVTVLAACSSDRPPAATGGSNAGGGDGTSEAGADGASSDGAVVDPNDGGDAAAIACNQNAPAGSPVAETAPDGAMPGATGGPIAPGTYVLTERDIYTDVPDDSLVQRSFVIDAAQLQIVEATSTGGAAPTAFVTRTAIYETFSTIGLSMRDSCPDHTATNAHYTATDTSLTLYFVDLGTAEVYTKQ